MGHRGVPRCCPGLKIAGCGCAGMLLVYGMGQRISPLLFFPAGVFACRARWRVTNANVSRMRTCHERT
eukprot:gene13775-biopygen12580